MRAVPASGDRTQLAAVHRHEIHIDGAANLGPSGGLAVFAPGSGADFTWHPLGESEVVANEGGVTLPLDLPEHELVLTLATEEDAARHRYVARIDLPAAASRPERTDFGRVPAPTRFAASAGSHAGPLLVARKGDPAWQRPTAATQGLFVNHPATLLLGAGEYELVDPLDASLRQAFSVPSASEITIDPRLARPRAGQR